MARLISVNVGLPRDIEWQGKTVHTAVWKTPIEGPRRVRQLNIDGDGQGDLAGHGGEHRAVLVYQIESYQYWQSQLGRNDFAYGQFGENLTVDGLSDAEVCIGDRYRIGRALFEVTQPRVTCYRVGIRMNEPRMAALLVAHGRPGFYFRVLEEGDVQAGDEIELVEPGPERISVSKINALLYMPGHPHDELVRALRIPALSDGWRTSLRSLLTQERRDSSAAGNVGLFAGSGSPPAWPGFRPFRISTKVRENGSVISLVLEPVDGQPLPLPRPGQFVVLKFDLGPATAMMRSYSLSAEPSTSFFRVSVKREEHGTMSTYIDETLEVGDIVHASAARGNFTLVPGSTPVVLLSAGIGVTPVLAMLHALAGETSTREIWWLYGARNGQEHPFAEETRNLLKVLPNYHRHIRYSSPGPADRSDIDFDAPGHFSVQVLQELGLPRNGDFYVCGPSKFMGNMTVGLANMGIGSHHIHTETFGAGASFAPGVAASPRQLPHQPAESPGSGPMVSFARSGLNVPWSPTFHSLLELAEACDVPVRWSCRTGVCHNCESGLVAGTICYEPTPIDAPAEGNLLICCSQPRGDIVIDL